MSTLVSDDTADLAASIALAGLKGMGPRRFRALLERWGAAGAWELIRQRRLDELVIHLGPASGAQRRNTVEDLVRRWCEGAATVDPQRELARHQERQIQVLRLSDPGYPELLRQDIEPPPVLFVEGDLSALDAPRVAIVGTRRCTVTGAGTARDLGLELAAAGVAVVSGLALGVDGAAHRGALAALPDHPSAARPVGVVASGHDVVYPPRHRGLWRAVSQQGVMLSEAPLGCRPAAWRFPARNRVIAALAQVVVVVESHVQGGSLHTVTEAARRGIDVMVCPGSVRNPASAGVNRLLAEGCPPVLEAADVLMALGLGSGGSSSASHRRPTPSATGKTILEAFGWEPANLEQLVARTSLDLGEVAVAMEDLIRDGWVAVQGGWFERVGR